MTICIFDPGIKNNNGLPSTNLGDLIIQRAVHREIKKIFPDREIITISTHAPLGKQELKLIRDCSLMFVGGSNLLSSNMNEYNQWKISLYNAFSIGKAILFGVGWWQYQDEPNLYTKALLKMALSNQFIHSVRDNYTKEKMQFLGIKTVLNTNCPTMWPLQNIKSEDIPQTKADNALLMLTDYNQKRELDKRLLELLFSKYKKVYVWPQGKDDAKYISQFGFSTIMLDRSLVALDKFIDSQISFDYIGTRLHGGIKCLCSKKRSLILEIDNRAKEIAQDTHIPTLDRVDFQNISKWIDCGFPTEISLDSAAIDRWKRQFSYQKTMPSSRILTK